MRSSDSSPEVCVTTKMGYKDNKLKRKSCKIRSEFRYKLCIARQSDATFVTLHMNVYGGSFVCYQVYLFYVVVSDKWL